MTLATTATPPANLHLDTPGSQSGAAAPASTAWAIDAAHTDILFSAKHMMVTTVRGTFHEVDGSVILDEADPTRSSGEVRVTAASLNTGSGPRDGHLRSPDFFDVEQYPSITFRSTGIEHVRGDEYRVTGDLTIRQTTRPATFDATFLGFYTGMSGNRRAGISARTRINRKDWGLGWNVALEAGGWLVGEDVTIEVELAVEQPA
jgi:polyisoprenoid-binding protein YceI